MIGFKFKTCAPNIDESALLNQDLSPIKLCEGLASLKAKKISSKFNNDIIISGDTIVSIDNDILGKPQNNSEAYKMLDKLNNKTHTVFTGISIQCQNKKIIHTFHESTRVTFNKISQDDIMFYIDNFDPYDKAGSYAIQDWSSIFVKKINGCFYNVVGFPLSKFFREFNKLELKISK